MHKLTILSIIKPPVRVNLLRISDADYLYLRMFNFYVIAGLSPYENEDECSTHVVSERPYTANSTVTTAHTAPHTAATTAAITTAATTTTLDGCNDGREGKDRVNLVSFDDYHALWRGIATSITGYKPSDDCTSLSCSKI